MTRFYFNKDDNIYENFKILILFYKSKKFVYKLKIKLKIKFTC